jgi:hypothetical protein
VSTVCSAAWVRRPRIDRILRRLATRCGALARRRCRRDVRGFLHAPPSLARSVPRNGSPGGRLGLRCHSRVPFGSHEPSSPLNGAASRRRCSPVSAGDCSTTRSTNSQIFSSARC